MSKVLLTVLFAFCVAAANANVAEDVFFGEWYPVAAFPKTDDKYNCMKTTVVKEKDVQCTFEGKKYTFPLVDYKAKSGTASILMIPVQTAEEADKYNAAARDAFDCDDETYDGRLVVRSLAKDTFVQYETKDEEPKKEMHVLSRLIPSEQWLAEFVGGVNDLKGKDYSKICVSELRV